MHKISQTTYLEQADLQKIQIAINNGFMVEYHSKEEDIKAPVHGVDNAGIKYYGRTRGCKLVKVSDLHITPPIPSMGLISLLHAGGQITLPNGAQLKSDNTRLDLLVGFGETYTEFELNEDGVDKAWAHILQHAIDNGTTNG